MRDICYAAMLLYILSELIPYWSLSNSDDKCAQVKIKVTCITFNMSAKYLLYKR